MFAPTAISWDQLCARSSSAPTMTSASSVSSAQSAAIIATSSTDTTARIWDTETGQCVVNLRGHEKEVVNITFSHSCAQTGHSLSSSAFFAPSMSHTPMLLTSSFDETARLWDLRSGQEARIFAMHTSEITQSVFNYDSTLVATSSLDGTCRLWAIDSGKCIATLGSANLLTRLSLSLETLTPYLWFSGCGDELLDCQFNSTGSQLAAGSNTGTVAIWDVRAALAYASMSQDAERIGTDCLLHRIEEAHQSDVNRVIFNPRGDRLMSLGSDGVVRMWCTRTGTMLDDLLGHSDEVFSGCFNYEGDTVITASKDNTCRVWRLQK